MDIWISWILEKNTSRMRGEGWVAFAWVCAYGPWAQSVMSMWRLTWQHHILWQGRVSGANVGVTIVRLCLCVGCSGEMRFTWHRILRTWRVSGIFWVCFEWQAQLIHTFCGRDSILVTCVENSWQEQHLVRCVWRRYCEQDLHRFVVLFLYVFVLFLRYRWRVFCCCMMKKTCAAWWKIVDIVARGLMFPLFFIQNSAFGLGSIRLFPRQNLHWCFPYESQTSLKSLILLSRSFLKALRAASLASLFCVFLLIWNSTEVKFNFNQTEQNYILCISRHVWIQFHVCRVFIKSLLWLAAKAAWSSKWSYFFEYCFMFFLKWKVQVLVQDSLNIC